MFRSRIAHAPSSSPDFSRPCAFSASARDPFLFPPHPEPSAGSASLPPLATDHLSPLFTRSPHQCHSMGLTFPLFSYSYALFRTAQNAIPNPFNAFRTLCKKHPGWGLAPCFYPSFVASLLHLSLATLLWLSAAVHTSPAAEHRSHLSCSPGNRPFPASVSYGTIGSFRRLHSSEGEIHA